MVRLYSSSSTRFIDDTFHDRITEKLKTAFFLSFRYEPPQSEINSWKNSLRAMSQVVADAGLKDHGIALEYQLPLSSKRLDFLIAGHDADSRQNAVIVELKQWEKCDTAHGEYVVSFVGHQNRDLLHPAAQVGHYKQYLEDTSTVFQEDPAVSLHACSYLHNYVFAEHDCLLDSRFDGLLKEFPLFTSKDADPLSSFLTQRLSGGEGVPILERIEQSKYAPSKKLLDHVGQILQGRNEYVLLDEQLVVYDRIMQLAKNAAKSSKKQAVIIHGGPGTGKSVIALNLLAGLSREGLNSHYATGSRAFTTTLREIVGNRAGQLVKYFNNYMRADLEGLDVIICDEAHRIRATSNNRFTPGAFRSKLRQIDEIIRASKVSVYFIDDKQAVRDDEIGSSLYIHNAAKEYGADLYEYKLEAQFRCSGSDGFINWVNNSLEIERTANVIWNKKERFDFQVFETPESLDLAIQAKVNDGWSARMTAGFCWKWSKPAPDGTLVDDVVVDGFRRPWNARSDAGRLHPDIPPEKLWAYDPRGVGQVGCIYTAQGFEFDYAGVIFGKDLVYRHGKGWLGQKNHSEDTVVKRSKDRFLDLVKNTYRVLLTRGLRGCYVYFMDEETRDFFLSRTESVEIN